MLLSALIGAFLLQGISAEAPIQPTYLPPAPPFQGYPPSRPYPPLEPPPQIGDAPAPEEDLESIVVEAPQFGRTQMTYGTPTDEFSSGRFNNGPYPAAQHNSNAGASFTHFPGSTRSYSDSQSYVNNVNQNSYARTNQHVPNTLRTSANFNNLPPYVSGSRLAPYQLFNENIQSATKSSYSHLGPSINSRPLAVDLKDQHHYQHEVDSNYALNSLRNKFDLPAHASYSKQRLNNQYLPPSQSLEPGNYEGYSYDRPSIPFNF